MPMPKIRRPKNMTDQIGRRLLPIATRGGAGDGFAVGARGGATQGPVGESWNEFRGSSRSANDTTSSAPVTGTVIYQDVVLFNPLCRVRICRRRHTGAASGVDLTSATLASVRKCRALARHRLDGGFCISGRSRRRIPTARRSRDVDGIVGLGFSREGLDRELGRGQRLGIETLGNVVALATSVNIALRCGQAEPLEGFGEVLVNADAAGVENAEIILAVGDAAIGGLAEPLRRALVVGALAAAVGIQHPEIVHRLGVAALGGLHVIAAGDIDVLFHAQALLVEGA